MANKFFKENKIFMAVVAFAFLVRMILFFQHHELWWDSGVYIGMGKYIFSFGKIGLWEHIRPVLLPLVLGAAWKLSLNEIVFGRVLSLILSAASIYLLYVIALKVFNKKTALIASAIFSFSTIFFYLGFRVYTEIPAVFFVLMGFYLFIKGRHFFSGLSFGMAFLAKFPAPLFLLAGLAVLFYKKKLKEPFVLCAGFAVPVIPYLIFNQIFYGNFLAPLIDARIAITSVLGCNVLRYKPFYYYFYAIFQDNPLNLFSLLGIFYFFRDFKGLRKEHFIDEKKTFAFLCVLLPFIYFSQLHCRDFRYLTLFIPFVAMFTASGIARFVKKKEAIIPIVVLVLAVSLGASLNFYFANEAKENTAAENYFRFLEGKIVEGEVWSSNPLISAYSDARTDKIYYPVFNSEISSYFYGYLKERSDRIEYIFLDNCGGGIICGQDDACEENLELAFSYLENPQNGFYLVYDENRGRCFYKVYKNREFS